jgi:prephenate dehydrogenase
MKIAIIGLGLIGGSWGLALKEWAKSEEGRAAQLEIVGFDVKGSQKSLANRMKVVDEIVGTPMDAAKNAAVVIVATPVMAIKETFEDIAPVLANGAIVTDTASTKRDVMQWAQELLPSNVSFIGGHPMAGKTASLEEATPTLFKGCTYCLIPSLNAKQEAIDSVARLVEIVEAKAHFIDATEHDSEVAGVSHLPYVAAVSLVRLATGSEGWREMGNLASSGFQDTTRLAMGSPEMWSDICRTNSDMLVNWIDRYQVALNEMKRIIVSGGMRDELGHTRPVDETKTAELKNELAHIQLIREKWQMDKARGLTEFDVPAAPVNKEELKADYSRWLTGGLFKRRKPEDDNKK